MTYKEKYLNALDVIKKLTDGNRVPFNDIVKLCPELDENYKEDDDVPSDLKKAAYNYEENRPYRQFVSDSIVDAFIAGHDWTIDRNSQAIEFSVKDEKMFNQVIEHVKAYQRQVNPANETGESELTKWLQFRFRYIKPLILQDNPYWSETDEINRNIALGKMKGTDIDLDWDVEQQVIKWLIDLPTRRIPIEEPIKFCNAHCIDEALNNYCIKKYNALYTENGGKLSFARLQHMAMDIKQWVEEQSGGTANVSGLEELLGAILDEKKEVGCFYLEFTRNENNKEYACVVNLKSWEDKAMDITIRKKTFGEALALLYKYLEGYAIGVAIRKENQQN